MNGDTDINYGAIYENVVAQELRAHGFDLYYFNSKKVGEVDFVVEYKGGVLPIEVKSGKDYRRHAALDHCLACADFHLDRAIVLCNGNVSKAEGVLYAPIYGNVAAPSTCSRGASVQGGLVGIALKIIFRFSLRISEKSSTFALDLRASYRI